MIIQKEVFILRQPKKGIKRHEALKPLSQHHMAGLHVALKLSRAGTDKSRLTINEIIRDAEVFWIPDGSDHFREEEDILLPVYAKYEKVDTETITNMLVEHVLIRSKMQQLLEKELSVEEMQGLGTLLEKHIREEERVIFPMIEQALPEEELCKLAPYLHHDV